MAHPSEDDLVLVALGEPLAAVTEHVAGCAACAREVDALARTVQVARDADPMPAVDPPPHVWERVARELGVAPDPPASLDAPAAPGGRAGRARALAPVPGRVRALLPASVAAVIAVVVGIGVLAANRGSEAPEPPTAPLVAFADDPGEGGRTVLSGTPQARTLLVDTTGLPATDGFYEVWLMDPADGDVLALGALDRSGHAVLAVPPEVDLGAYGAVDVSLEPDDGVDTHSGRSVLRGDLPA